MDRTKSHNILVIDEEVDYASLVQQILEKSCPNGSTLFWFEYEGAVLDFLYSKTPPIISIVLLDVNNSNFNGIALLKKLKDESSHLKIIPIVIFSRSRDFSVIRQSFSLGANSWVHKPTALENYQTVLETICEFWLKHTILPSFLP